MSEKTGTYFPANDNLKREIELNRIIGEMAVVIRVMLILHKNCMNESQISTLEDLLKRYEEFFKNGY